MPYNHKEIEKKWQERWETSEVFHASDTSDKPKFYGLIEFPYPSGAGLHIGHPRSNTAMDVIVRKRRMEGFNVLFPIGWDAFGLPTENYAIKTGRKPQDVTRENIDTFRRQLKSLGFSFDWSREVNTTDPEYYKWTQWMFLQFFKAGLAYKAKMPINWCLSCKIGLANEEVVNGVCERCGGQTEKREKEQWMIAITKYAERLLADLDTVNYQEKIKVQQRNWIGKSEGAEIVFPLIVEGQPEGKYSVSIFTTRPDTIFGATFLVISPEVAQKWIDAGWNTSEEVQKYILTALKQDEIARTSNEKEKTGVDTGVIAINPANQEKIPVWVADYVLGQYGTGAIMAVPQHDERDRLFAEKFHLPIVDRPLVSSDEIVEKVGGVKTIKYKLRDWVFSRQRYWGEPIPLVHCETCSPETDGWVPLPDDQLPLVLPVVDKYEPTDSGESPLAAITDWVNTTCSTCHGPAKRETDTMPNWAGSSWYFLRYIDPHNNDAFAAKENLKHWMPVDWYNGGMEHTTLHLLYSRFWNKFLFDQGLVPTSEPYAKRTSHGLILASDGTKMSKSKGNVVNPDEVVSQYGADAVRLYQMFMGPFAEPVPWSVNGLVGMRRFLDKVNALPELISESESIEVTRALHQTIKKVTSDIENMRFNTAVSQMMIFVNTVKEHSTITKESFEIFLRLLSPFAPHLTNELHEALGEHGLLEEKTWPMFEVELAKEEVVEIGVQINGKVRTTISLSPTLDEESAFALAKADPNIQKHLEGVTIVKVIYVAGRILNIVIGT